MMLTSTTNSMPGDWEMEWLWAFRLSIQKPDSTFPDVEATGIVLGRRTAPGGALWSLPATTMASNRCGSDILTVPSGTWKTNSPLVRANAYEKSTWKNITPCSSPTILGWKKQYSLALSLMYLSTVVLQNQKLHHVPHIQPPLNAPEDWSAVKGTGPTIRYA